MASAKKNLVIVESPAKAKTIEKYLGGDYKVVASMGHLRDLPKSTLGIDIEKDFGMEKKMNFVSTSRDMFAAPKRNNTRWKYGIVIDGDSLSNRYSIEPFSFAGNALQYSTSSFRVKELRAYENGVYKLSMVNWPTIQISKNVFDSIRNSIENMPEEMKQKKKLQVIDGGKRVVGGTKLLKKYLFNVPSGGIMLTPDILKGISSEFTKSSNINEMEERIWSDTDSININGCILGVSIPKQDVILMHDGSKELTEDLKLLRDTIYNNKLKIFPY